MRFEVKPGEFTLREATLDEYGQPTPGIEATATVQGLVQPKTARELAEKLNQITPGSFKKKVFFSGSGAESVESMAEGAANALLKTLEEPRGDTLLILLSSNPQRLLETIRSA